MTLALKMSNITLLPPSYIGFGTSGLSTISSKTALCILGGSRLIYFTIYSGAAESASHCFPTGRQRLHTGRSDEGLHDHLVWWSRQNSNGETVAGRSWKRGPCSVSAKAAAKIAGFGEATRKIFWRGRELVGYKGRGRPK